MQVLSKHTQLSLYLQFFLELIFIMYSYFNLSIRFQIQSYANKCWPPKLDMLQIHMQYVLVCIRL